MIEVSIQMKPCIVRSPFKHFLVKSLHVPFRIVFAFKLVVVDRLLVELHFYFLLDKSTAWPDRVCVVQVVVKFLKHTVFKLEIIL